MKKYHEDGNNHDEDDDGKNVEDARWAFEKRTLSRRSLRRVLVPRISTFRSSVPLVSDGPRFIAVLLVPTRSLRPSSTPSGARAMRRSPLPSPLLSASLVLPLALSFQLFLSLSLPLSLTPSLFLSLALFLPRRNNLLLLLSLRTFTLCTYGYYVDRVYMYVDEGSHTAFTSRLLSPQPPPVAKP